MKVSNIKVIVFTPAAIGERTDASNQQDGDLNQYSKSVRNLAIKNELPLCDLRREFQEYNMKNNAENKEKSILTTDRVHLNELGNQFVADKMLPLILK